MTSQNSSTEISSNTIPAAFSTILGESRLAIQLPKTTPNTLDQTKDHYKNPYLLTLPHTLSLSQGDRLTRDQHHPTLLMLDQRTTLTYVCVNVPP